MNTPRHFKDILRLSYGCIACDGYIDPEEVICLRSIGVQMSIPVEEVDAGINAVKSEFGKDAMGMLVEAKQGIKGAGLNAEEVDQLMDVLVQLVEADGEIHVNEMLFVQHLVDDLDLDREALAESHPEWRDYLATSIKDSASLDSLFSDAFDKT
jgi:uncharacterized tellurite resistance protein B-like protein